jgi:methylated-DNA-[protein]-cysteine S-methyltransferase
MNGTALFATALGPCGIAWTPRGIAGVQLPEGSEPRTRARLARRFPGWPELPAPPSVARVIGRIVALLRGEIDTFDDVALDMTGVPPFHQRVYAAALTIRPGHTMSYGEIARALGDVQAARAVGQALGRNPFAPIVPCHRVLGADGRPGGFSAHGGVAMKRRLLALEGTRIAGDLPLFAESGS